MPFAARRSLLLSMHRSGADDDGLGANRARSSGEVDLTRSGA
jgi:hypothetical protein